MLKEGLEQHAIWLKTTNAGTCADLRNANLENANLENADLRKC